MLSDISALLLSGMLHVPALPGTPASSLGMSEILDKVMEEARVYSEAGVDGVIIENMHDTPYCHARLSITLKIISDSGLNVLA